MQVEVHGGKSHHKRRVVKTMYGLIVEKFEFLAVLTLGLHVIVSGKKEASGATGRIAHSFSNLWLRYVNHGLDERTRSEVLSGTALFILTVALQNTFIDSTLYIAVHHKPLLVVNHCDDFFEIDRLVNLVLRFSVNGAYKVIQLGKGFKSLLILFQ